jgi:hypothetical protein
MCTDPRAEAVAGIAEIITTIAKAAATLGKVLVLEYAAIAPE